jgi:hypothetical protein
MHPELVPLLPDDSGAVSQRCDSRVRSHNDASRVWTGFFLADDMYDGFIAKDSLNTPEFLDTRVRILEYYILPFHRNPQLGI